MASSVLPALRAIAGFFLPTFCAHCDAEGAGLCAACSATLVARDLRRTVSVVGGTFTVHSAFEMGEVTRSVLRAVKEDGRIGLIGHLAPGLAQAVRRARPGGTTVAVVPITTSARAYRARGFRVVDEALRRAAVPTVPLLRVGRMRDQRLLGRDARERNVAGVFDVCRDPPPRCDGVVLVDDVITTGATMRDARRALLERGIPVLAAACAVSTPRRTFSGNHA